MVDGQNIISLGYDIDKLTTQQKVVVDYLQQTLELADQLDRRKIAPDISGQGDLNAAFSKQKQVIDELTLSTSEYNKMLSSIATTQAKQNALSSEAAEQLAQEKEALRQRNAEVKNTAAVNSAAEGSINQLKAALSLLTAQYDKMSAAERTSASGTQLQQKIKGQSDALKQLEGETGRYQRNVGNYTGAMKILEKELITVRQKIDDFTNSGNGNSEAVQHLVTQEGMLQQILDRNEKGFSSLTMEVRANERALATMYEQGMESSEAFNTLQTEIAKAKRQLSEFQQNQKLLSSTAPALQASVVAAKGLAGTYAIGAGAAALFADGNEKVEKELNKLVAVMTILQGLNEVHELLEKRLAIAKLFSAGGTVIQTAALRVYTYVTEAATTATKAFRTAIISTGLGALLVLLTSFISGMEEAKDATSDETEALKDYKQAIEDVNEDLLVQNKVIESQIANSKEHVKQRAGSEAEIAKLTQKGLLEQIKSKTEANRKLTELEDDLMYQKSKLIGKDDKESIAKLEELNKNEQDIVKEKNKNLMGILDDGLKLNQENEKEKTRVAEEGRKSQKANSEARVIDIEKEQISLKAVMSNEKASYNDRLKATEDYYALQRQIQNRKENISLNTPNLTSGEIAKIKSENAKALAEIDSAKAMEEKNLADQEKQRLLTIQSELFKSSQDRKMAFEQQIYNDDKRSLTERLSAYDEYTKNQIKLINEEYQLKISQAKKGDEIVALEKELQDKLTIEDLKGVTERKRLLESALKSILEKQKLNISIGADDAQILAIERLNTAFKNGAINAKQYAEKLKEIENTAKENSLKETAAAIENKISKMKEAGVEASDLEATLKNIQLQQAKNNGQDEIDALEKRKEKTKEVMDEIVGYESAASEAIQGIVDGQHEMVMNQIQKEMDASTKQKDLEIANIEKSSLSAQEKAAQVALANARAQMQEDILNKKKRDEQVKQAKFDKALQEFNLGLKLIIDLADFDWIKAAADAAGLVALAAKPVPKYAEGAGIPGRPDHKGGVALIGEGSNPELVTLPGGESFIADEAMLLNLPAKTIVQPLTSDDINSSIYNSMLRNSGRMLVNEYVLNKKQNDILGAKIDSQTSKIVRAIKDQKSTTIVNNNINLGWTEHIKKQVYN